MSQQCCKEVWRSGTWRPGRCSKPGKIEREGKFYCSVHDPVARSARNAERDARWAAEREASDRAYRFKNECMDAIRAIAAGHNDPRELAQSIMDRAEPRAKLGIQERAEAAE